MGNELQVLEEQLSELTLQKAQNEALLYKFSIDYNKELSDLLEEILFLKKEILYFETIKKTHNTKSSKKKRLNEKYVKLQEEILFLKEQYKSNKIENEKYQTLLKDFEQKKDKVKEDIINHLDSLESMQKQNDKYREFQQANERYNSFKNSIDEIKQKEIQTLSKEEKKELKSYLKKLSKKFHPDLVIEEYKSQTQEIMQQAIEYFNNQDLSKLKEFYEEIKDLNFYKKSDEVESENFDDLKIEYLKSQIEKLKEENDFIINNEMFKLASMDYKEVISKQKENLSKEIDKLNEYLVELKTNVFLLLGNNFEKLVGEKFEKDNHLVVYNGFIKKFYDEGIDVITIKDNYINLIQCKNWKDKKLDIDILERIYYKLNNYSFDFVNIPLEEIVIYQEKSKEEVKTIIDKVKNNFKDYKKEKILYLSSDKIIDISLGKYLKILSDNIFLYKDMKIVIFNI